MASGEQPGDRWAKRAAWIAATAEVRRRELTRLVERAAAAGDGVAGCRTWIALERQTGRDLRSLDGYRASRAGALVAERLERDRAFIEDVRTAASLTAASFDADVRSEAEATVGLRVAVAGKGGVGKTALAATLARVLARRGRRVAAVDADTNPGLAFSLGVPDPPEGLPPELLRAHEGAAYGWHLAPHVSPEDAVLRHSVAAPDGVRFLTIGKLGGEASEAAKRSVVALQQILLGFAEPGWDVVADLEAGLTTPFERYHQFADLVLLVVGPTWRSALTARRLLPILEPTPVLVVATRTGDEADHPGLSPAVRIPFDPAVADAERRGLAPLDVCPESPAVQAIATLAERLLAQEVPV